MASWTQNDIQDFVRDHADLDSEDLSDNVLKRFIEDGFNRVYTPLRNTDHYAAIEPLVTDLDIESYSLRPLGTTTFSQVLAVRGERWMLQPGPHRQAMEMYPTNTATSREPTEFSNWGRTLYLWPTPNAIYNLEVIGWREPSDWIASNSAIDAPETFHELIAWWALNRAYAQQDDFELSEFYREEFTREIALRSAAEKERHSPVPLAMGNLGMAQRRFLVRNGLGPLQWPAGF